MIIVVQKQTKKGIYYEFTDYDTGLMRTWYPPNRMKPVELRQTFEVIARSFQYTANIGPRADIVTTSVPPTAPDKNMTLFDFCEKVFLPRKIITIAENTRDRWVNSLDTRIYPELGFHRMDSITPAMLTDFLLSMQAIGLACSTVNRFYTILKSIFKMAYLMDFFEKNPMDKVERPRSRKDELRKTQPDAYTAKEIVAIMENLENEPIKFRTMIYVMCDTGMRRGECLGLTWDCIDLDKGTIEVRGSLYYTKNKGVFFDTPKNKQPRTTYISPATVDLLREMWLLNFVTYESPYVFCKAGSGEPMHPHTPTRRFKAIGEKYHIDHFHPHKLRHSFASIAILHR